MTIETAEIMVHPVLDENRLLSNIGHLKKIFFAAMAVRVCLIGRCLIWEIEHRAASLARDVTISTRQS
jgi:hypothetical protein